MKRKPRRVTIDATGLSVPAPTISELLSAGTVGEVRRGLDAVSFLLRVDKPLPADVRKWLADALDAIARGKDPAVALRLKRGRGRRKIYGLGYAKAVEAMIADLERQGISREEARDIVGRLNVDKLELVDRSPAGETVKKREQRARKK